MALTFTATSPVKVTSLGRIANGTINFDSSYPSGGESYLASLFGLSIVESVEFGESISGKIFEHDKTNKKIKLYSGGSSTGTTSAGTSHNHAFTGNADSKPLIVEEVVTVTANVGTLAKAPRYITAIDVTAGGVTGAFSVIPNGETPITTQCAVNVTTGALTFAAADAVTSVRVTYFTQRSGTLFSTNNLIVDEPVIASASKVNLSTRAALVQYVYDSTGGTVLTPIPSGEAPGAGEYALDINDAGNTSIDTNAGIDGNSLKVTFVPFSALTSTSQFIDDTDITLISEVGYLSEKGYSITNAISNVSPFYESDTSASTKPTIALTHNADPVGVLSANPLFIVEGYGDSQTNIGVLQSNCNATTDVLGETANGIGGGVAASCRFFVKHNLTPAGVQIYINESASDQLSANFVSETDCYVVMPFEMAAGGIPGHACRVLVKHDASAATYKPLYFDDNGAADAQLCFVDTGAAGGTVPAADVTVLGNNYLYAVSGNLGVAAAQTITRTPVNYDGLLIPGHGVHVVAEEGGGVNHAMLLAGPSQSASDGVAVWNPNLNTITTNETSAVSTLAMSMVAFPEWANPGTSPTGSNAAEATHTHSITAASAAEVGNGTDQSTVSVEATIYGS